MKKILSIIFSCIITLILIGCSKEDPRLSGFDYKKTKNDIIIMSAKKSMASNKSIEIPDCVTQIGLEGYSSCFMNCTSLEELTIPKSVKYIGTLCFNNCKRLGKIYYDGSIADWCNIKIDGPIYDSNTFLNMYILSLNGKDTYNNKQYELLNDINIPAGVKRIGNYQFSNLRYIKNVVLNDEVEYIGDFSFYNCYEMENIVLPKTTKEIKQNAFVCFNTSYMRLQKIYYSGTMADWCNISFENSWSNPCTIDSTVLYLQDDNGNIEYDGKRYTDEIDVSIPNGQTTIKAYVFSGFDFLKSIYIPKSITKIEEGAFACRNLGKVFYEGTESDWGKIEIKNFNNYLEDAEIIFNS